jgi:hypothetical protein
MLVVAAFTRVQRSQHRVREEDRCKTCTRGLVYTVCMQ